MFQVPSIDFGWQIYFISSASPPRSPLGDIVQVHNEGPRVHWRLTLVEKLIKGMMGWYVQLIFAPAVVKQTGQ